MIENYNVYGLKVSNFSLQQVEALFTETIRERKNIVLFGHSLGYITLFKTYPELYAMINSFDLMVCDGTQFNWYCRLSGFRLKTVISIPNISNFTLDYASRHGLKVLLFGAKEKINQAAGANLQKKYPGLRLLPGINGYFKEPDEPGIVSAISAQAPDVLLIGISTPIKEKFAFKYRDALNARIIIPCGGMIDVYSGYTRQSPAWIKKLGLATPFRIIQEPRRLFWPHTRMILSILFKLIPVTLFNRVILRKKDFNITSTYLNK